MDSTPIPVQKLVIACAVLFAVGLAVYGYNNYLAIREKTRPAVSKPAGAKRSSSETFRHNDAGLGLRATHEEPPIHS